MSAVLTNKGEAKAPFGARPVPRYTSYPTAPNFTPAVNAQVHAKWLGDLGVGTSTSVYLHVPYCVELCHYCGCNTHATQRAEPVERYVEDLVNEISLIGTLSRKSKVRRIHWGGGTPSILGASGLARVYSALDRNFDLGELSEHAIELDPRRVTAEIASALYAIGVNRANFGVQEFSEKVQKAIGRVQPFEVVDTAVRTTRKAGIGNIGIDLMYGLPHQTVEDVQFSATLGARFDPKRVAIFGYAHVPWFKKQQRLIDVAALPDHNVRFRQFRAAERAWADFGYQQIGMDHFAQPDDPLAVASRRGALHRNFQGYTDDNCSVLIGFGASAISRFPWGYTQNHPAAAAYSAEVRYGNLATIRGIETTPEDELRGEVIERLMCDFVVDLDAIVEHRNLPAIFSAELAAIDKLSQSGLVRRKGRKIYVLESGKPFVRIVASIFDKYLGDGTGKHSQAV